MTPPLEIPRYKTVSVSRDGKTWPEHHPSPDGDLVYVADLAPLLQRLESDLEIARLGMQGNADEVAALRAERDRLQQDVALLKLALAEESGFTQIERGFREAAESRLTALHAYVQHAGDCGGEFCSFPEPSEFGGTVPCCGSPDGAIHQPGAPDYHPYQRGKCTCGLAALTETGAT